MFLVVIELLVPWTRCLGLYLQFAHSGSLNVDVHAQVCGLFCDLDVCTWFCQFRQSFVSIVYAPHSPHSSSSTLLIFHTHHFPNFAFSTLRTPHIPPNPRLGEPNCLDIKKITFSVWIEYNILPGIPSTTQQSKQMAQRAHRTLPQGV